MYYGEEIGMENNDPKSKDDVKDPIGKLGWPIMKGRDGERTPMQWTDGANGGFTSATPWLPVPASAKTHNVASESKDPDSILNFYKRLLSLRHTEKALLDGDYIALNTADPNVLSYVRRYKDDAVLVVLNMSATEQKVTFDLSSLGLPSPLAQIVLTNQREHRVQRPLRSITLDPFAAYILKVKQ